MGFANLPTVAEEREIVPLCVGVLLDLFDVQVDPETGLVGDLDVSVHDLIVVAREKVFLPFDVEFVEDFLDKKVAFSCPSLLLLPLIFHSSPD